MATIDNDHIKAMMDIASSKDFAPKQSPDGLPYLGVYVGELESLTGRKLLGVIPFAEINSLCLLSNEKNRDLVNKTIQSIVLRFAAALPNGMCHLTAYDGTGMGANLITLSSLCDVCPDSKVITDSFEFQDNLKKLQEHVPYVIQKVLGYKHSNQNLLEYNRTEIGHREPYRILVIADYPRTLNEGHCRILDVIIKNAKKAGIFVIMSYDTTCEMIDYSGKYSTFVELMNRMTVIYERDGVFNFKNISNEDILQRFKLRLDPGIINNTDNVLKFIEEKGCDSSIGESLMLVDNLPNQTDWWNDSSADCLSIPFGVSSDDKVANLMITQVNGQNVAVVVGVSGSGKSVFLRTIIISAAVHYSPEELELYLIDFSGVEFSAFADYKLPQAKVIAPESEREYGISVLRRIREEGTRRMELFRQAGVNSISDYRRLNPDKPLPRILVIIDEFQKLFENDMDKISEESESIIHIIIQEYRKFGINLILATQRISKYANKVELGMIANRVVFDWAEDDPQYLFAGKTPTVSLSTGECIYKSKTNRNIDNVVVKSYNLEQGQLRDLLPQIESFASRHNMLAKDRIVFRSEAPVFLKDNKALGKVEKSELPSMIKIYLGEPIAITEEHVYIELQRNSNANMLVVGGTGSDTGERIAINCVASLLAAHEDKTAHFAFFNYIPVEERFHSKPEEMYSEIPFSHDFVDEENQKDYLDKLKSEIKRRKSDKLIPKRHIYLSVYAFQMAFAFRSTDEYGDLSEISKTLSFILEQGPLVGVFTILQVDSLDSMSKSLGRTLDKFNHRMVLQVNEDDSRSLLDSPVASQISKNRNDNRSSSKNRAYYYNRNNNTIVKFKPYEL